MLFFQENQSPINPPKRVKQAQAQANNQPRLAGGRFGSKNASPDDKKPDYKHRHTPRGAHSSLRTELTTGYSTPAAPQRRPRESDSTSSSTTSSPASCTPTAASPTATTGTKCQTLWCRQTLALGSDQLSARCHVGVCHRSCITCMFV